MPWNISCANCPYSGVECIKTNVAEVVAVPEPNNTQRQRIMAKPIVSRQTTERHNSQTILMLQAIIQNDLNNFLAFNLVLIESTDIQDSTQVSVFVRYVNSDVNVKEET